MIPQYCQERLLRILKDFKLELFRTGSGECILTKTGEGREIKSIFPKIPQNFKNIGENHVFSHSGRISTNVQGEIYISSEKINISSTQMECDAILESNKVIIAIEAKKGFEKSFSIHQIV